MDAQPIAVIEHHFSDLEDPRIDRTKLHKLLDIVVIAICAVICGADTWVEVELSWPKQYIRSRISHAKSIDPLGDYPEQRKASDGWNG